MRYVALIRGIGPTNPNMKGEKLKAVFEGLGFTNVHPVIASGNIVFESPVKNTASLETKIEREMSRKLGFERATIVRSRVELEKLVAKDPFRGVRDERPNYLIVTFFKDRRPELPSVINQNAREATKFMSSLERAHGKAITTRTWKTIHRILKKMAATKRTL